MAIDDTSRTEPTAESATPSDGTERERVEAGERRETTQTVTDSYVVLTRRLIRPAPAVDAEATE